MLLIKDWACTDFLLVISLPLFLFQIVYDGHCEGFIAVEILTFVQPMIGARSSHKVLLPIHGCQIGVWALIGRRLLIESFGIGRAKLFAQSTLVSTRLGSDFCTVRLVWVSVDILMLQWIWSILIGDNEAPAGSGTICAVTSLSRDKLLVKTAVCTIVRFTVHTGLSGGLLIGSGATLVVAIPLGPRIVVSLV